MARQGRLPEAEAARILAAAQAPYDPDDVVDILDSTDPDRSSGSPSSTADQPFQSTANVPVLEEQAERIQTEAPRLNKRAAGQSKNPRFNPPGR